MSFPRPTLQEQVARAQSFMQQRFPGDGVYRAKSVLHAISYVMGLLMHAAYAYLAWVARQISYLTSDTDMLEQQAAEYGMTYLPANFAVGNITVTGVIGTDVAAGKRWQSATGIVYEVVADVFLTGTSGTVAVKAIVAGEAGNLDAGATLTRINPIIGLDGTALVAAGGLANGTDIETADGLRARLKARKQKVAAGGKASDYETWAREANTDIENVWVTTELGEGTVSVRFTLREASGSPIPAGPVVAAVDDYIQLQRPVTAHVYTIAPIATAQDYTIHLVPDTAQTRTNVTDALKALLQAEGSPGGTILITHQRTAISTAGGVVDYTLDITADITYALGHLPVLGVISWV